MDNNIVGLVHEIFNNKSRQALSELNDIFEENNLKRFDAPLILFIPTETERLGEKTRWEQDAKELFAYLKGKFDVVVVEYSKHGFEDVNYFKNNESVLPTPYSQEVPIKAMIRKIIPVRWIHREYGGEGKLVIDVRNEKIEFDHWEHMCVPVNLNL